MKKQVSLALALCLTVIVGFAVVAYGSQFGFFKKSSADGQEDTGASLRAIATLAAEFSTTPTPALEPEPVPETIFVDQYVYEDVFVTAPASAPGGSADEPLVQGPEAPAPLPAPIDSSPTPVAPTAPVAPTEGSHDDDEGHDDDHDDGRESESGHEEGHLEKEDLKGTVVAVSGGTFTITGSRLGNAVISVTPDTEYRADGGDSFSFAQIQVGMYLDMKVFEGEGDRSTGPDGTWVADRVKWEPGGY